MDLIFRFVKNIVDTRYEDLPRETVEVTKRCVIDTLACLIAGSTASGCKAVVDYVQGDGGTEESSILVYGGKVPSANAVLANSTMARALDFDDVQEAAGAHSSATMIPTALAMAEKIGKLSGKDFIAAIALGADMLCRMRLAPKFGSGITGWSSETHGPFGATAVAGKVLGLDEERLWNAMGLALSQAASTLQCFADGALAVRLQQGLSARAGIVSALLAQKGLTGAKNVLEGRYGFYPTYFNNEFDASKLTKDLGKRFEGTYVSVKPYPSCKYTHGPIAATLAILSEHAIRPEEITTISVEVNQSAYNLCCEPRQRKFVPESIIDAQFSIPYTVGVAAVKRNVFIDNFTPTAIKEESVLRIAGKVTPRVGPELAKIGLTVAPSIVEIKTSGNKSYSKRIDYVKGHANNPMTTQDCIDKLERCLAFSAIPLKKENIDKLIKFVDKLEEREDVTAIAELLLP